MKFAMFTRQSRGRSILPVLLLTVACSGGGGDSDSATGAAGGDPPGSAPAASALPAEPDTTVAMEMPATGPDPLPDIDVSALEAAVEVNPDDPAVHRELAIGLFQAGRRADAVAHFERAAELNTSVDSLMDLANAYGFASRLEEAGATYRRVLQIRPEHPSATYNLANVLFLSGDMEGALALFDRAIEIDPAYQLAYYHRGFALKMLERHREAYLSFAKVMEFDPTNGEELKAYDNSLYEMASLDITMGAHQRAEEMLVALLEANPEHPNAHYLYGQLLMRQGRVDEAQARLQTHMEVSAKVKPTGTVATGH